MTVSRSKLPEYAKRATPKGARWHREATWTDVWEACQGIASSKRAHKAQPVAAAIAEDFALHLEENDLVDDETPEVYTRDVSSQESTRLFFTYHMYSCQPKYFEYVRKNRYFAPYFTRKAATTLEGLTVVPVGEGLSYVARIEQAHRVPREDLASFLREERPDDHRELFELMRGYHRGLKEITVLLLGQPHQMFMTSRKRNCRSRRGARDRG